MADVRSSLGVALVLRPLDCSTGSSPTAPTAAREEDQFQSIVARGHAPGWLPGRVRDTAVAEVGE